MLWAAGGGGGKGNVGVRFISCALWLLMTLLPRVTVGLGNLATLRRKGPKVSTSTPHHHHPHTHTHPSQQRCVSVIEVAADFQTFFCWHGNRNVHPPPPMFVAKAHLVLQAFLDGSWQLRLRT